MSRVTLLAPPRAIAFLSFPVVLALALYSCSDETPMEPGSNIGPEGGTLSLADGAVTLIIPAGALSERVTILSAPSSTYPDSPAVLTGTVFAFAPRDLSFDLPVELSIKYDPADVPLEVTEPELEIYRVVDDDWRVVGGSRVETSDSTVTCSITGFSSFGILGLSPNQSLSAQLVTPDTMVWAGDSVRYVAEVEYRGGPGPPRSVVWSTSDTSVAKVNALGDGAGMVFGRASGEAFVIAVVNDRFVDSASVTVVESGDVRWRAELDGRLGQLPMVSLDAANRVYVVTGASWPDSGTSHVYTPLGTLASVFRTCASYSMTPSVTAEGVSFVTSALCTQRVARDGAVDWTLDYGTWDGGVAIGTDGAMIIANDHPHNAQQDAQHVVVSRIAPDGSLVWRDTLGPSPGAMYHKTAPSISSTGDVYLAWQDGSGQNWLSRISAMGTTVWTVPQSGWSKRSGPALFGDRVAVTWPYAGPSAGLAVYDTSGTLLWERVIGGGTASSAVIDADGNIYVVSENQTSSFDPNGNLRWSDWGGESGMYGIGAPTLLQNGQLVATCDCCGGDRNICARSTANGAILWHAALPGTPESPPAVAPDGTIYFAIGYTDSGIDELVALWNRVPPLSEGWPTEGGNMGRTRRQR